MRRRRPTWSWRTGAGGRFDDTRCALEAKAELLAQSAGLVDHFELRMGVVPYSFYSIALPSRFATVPVSLRGVALADAGALSVHILPASPDSLPDARVHAPQGAIRR